MEKIINNEHLSNIKFAADCAIKDPDSIYSQEFFMLLDETFGSKGDYESPTQAVAAAWLINRVNEMDKRAEAAEAKLAELQNQGPVVEVSVDGGAADDYTFTINKSLPDGVHELFTRPAPAADLEKKEPSALRWRFKHNRDLPAMAWTYIDNKKYFDEVRGMEGAEIEEVFTRPAPDADLAGLVPSEFPAIRLQKAKLWIDLVLMDKPGMKEAQTISAILRKIEDAGKKHE